MSTHITIRSGRPQGVIHRDIYGHFAEHLGRCIYEGIWVGEDSSIPNTRGIRNDVVGALRKLDLPTLRWPGGCFADEYHWKDGIGPRDSRPAMINTHWGAVVENNHFGTHEFFDLCDQLGTEAYVCGNVGSGTVREMMEWVEYMTSDADSPMANLRRRNGREAPWHLKYFGVGNESWGCGGSMRPEYYADNFRRYNTFVKNYSGQRIQRIACGANSEDYKWTEVMMQRVPHGMNGLSLHYYTIPTGTWHTRKGAATGFPKEEWHSTLWQALRMDDIVSKHAAIMDRHDPERKVGMIVDEWGTWCDPDPGTNPGFLYQQNTIRDALVAALTLHIFHRHCARVTMANIAQTINVLQAMVLTDKEKMILTPSYHVFEMFRVHQGAEMLPVETRGGGYTESNRTLPAVDASASRGKNGRIHLSLVNLHPDDEAEISIAPPEGAAAVSGRLLTAPATDSHNTFEQPETVAPVDWAPGEAKDGRVALKLPPRSVAVLAFEA